MELILWRHADAEDAIGITDDERALTKKGLRQAADMARWLEARLEGEWRVVASPARRALETVEPLRLPFEVTKDVGTGADARRVLAVVGWPAAERVIVVGHQPTLGHVAAELMGGRGDVAFRKGAVWWFATRTRNGDEGAILRAVMNPEMLA